MKKVVITIGTDTYSLKFGYGCLRNLADSWGVQGMQGVLDKFSEDDGLENDLSFSRIQIFIDLIYAAVCANGDTEQITRFNFDDCGDFLLSNIPVLTEITAALMESMPKTDQKEEVPGKNIRKLTTATG